MTRDWNEFRRDRGHVDSTIEPCEAGVRWTMSREVAEQLASIVQAEADRTGDAGWAEDALALEEAAATSDDTP